MGSSIGLFRVFFYCFTSTLTIFVFNQYLLAKTLSKEEATANKVGHLLEDKKTLDRAFTMAKRAVIEYPSSAILHKLLGQALSDREDNELACQSYLKALSLKPDDTDCMIRLARVEHRLGKSDEAIGRCNKALKLDPKLASAHYLKARIYMHEKKDRKSIEQFSKTIKLLPSSVQSRHKRAALYMILKEWKLAISDYNWLLNHPGNSKNYKYLANRGYSYEKLGQYKRALSDYNQGLKLGPNYRPLLVKRAALFERLGSIDKAKKDRMQLKSLDKDFVPFSFQPDWTGRSKH